MNKICTSLEQSNKLIELGIGIKTADMHYSTWTILNKGEYILSPNQGETIEELQEDYGNQIIPAWSLAALLIVLPQGTRLLKSATDEMYHCDCPKGNVDKWFDNPLDAAFEMVCWLKENRKI